VRYALAYSFHFQIKNTCTESQTHTNTHTHTYTHTRSVDNGPSTSAYSATQTVLLLPQHTSLKQQQLSAKGVRVNVRLEEHGLEFTAERLA